MKKEEKIFEIEAMRFTLDWIDSAKHKIKKSDIFGFRLHLRGQDWHIEVVTKQKIAEFKNFSYELDHWVYPGVARSLLRDKDAVILAICNDHGQNNFIEKCKYLFDESK